MKKMLALIMTMFLVNSIQNFSNEIEKTEGFKQLKKVRRELNETIEEKIFRTEDEWTATKEGFEDGRARVNYLAGEENELMGFANEIGVDIQTDRNLYGERFDKAQSEYYAQQEKNLKLLHEKENLEKTLKRLNEIEKTLRKDI